VLLSLCIVVNKRNCHRFHVYVRVAQPHEYAIFTLWDQECYVINETSTDIK